MTWMVTVSDAVPLLPSSQVMVTGTEPSCIGAVHSVCSSVGFASLPDGVVQRHFS